MRTKTKEMMEKVKLLYSLGWSRRKIAMHCGVTPPYVTKLIKMHEANRNSLLGWDYGLSTRVLNCLKRGSIPLDPQSIADSIDRLLIMRGIGHRSLDEIGNMLMDQGIIDSIDEWIEDGRRKQYNRRHAGFIEFKSDLSQQHSRHIGISNHFTE